MIFASRSTDNNRASAKASPPVSRSMPRPLGKIPGHERFLDIGEAGAGGGKPDPEIPGEAQIPMADLPTVATLPKPVDVELDVLAQRAFL